MIITNNIDSVYISVIEDAVYANATYAVHKINVAGLVSSEAYITGSLDGDNIASFKLPDGPYRITINSFDNNAPIIKQDFVVLYNYLPTVMGFIKEAVCKCNTCSGVGKLEELQKSFFNTIMFLSCKGILLNLPFLLTKNCELFSIIETEQEKMEYYGTFNFNYEERIREFFIALYLDLHYSYTNSIKGVVIPESQSLYSIFEVVEMKRCMYNLGLDFDGQISTLSKLGYSYDG